MNLWALKKRMCFLLCGSTLSCNIVDLTQGRHETIYMANHTRKIFLFTISGYSLIHDLEITFTVIILATIIFIKNK